MNVSKSTLNVHFSQFSIESESVSEDSKTKHMQHVDVNPDSMPQKNIHSSTISKSKEKLLFKPDSIESKINDLKIPESYISGCHKYATHLLNSYPEKSHKILTLGKQCLVINGSLQLATGNSFESYVYPRPASSLALAVESCIVDGEINKTKINKIFDQIIPKKECLEGKILVVSKNLCLIETMAYVKQNIEDYLKEKNIPYHFDFAISRIPPDCINSECSNTTTKQYYEKVRLMESDPNTTVWMGEPEEINAAKAWFDSLMSLDLGVFKSPPIPDIRNGKAVYLKNGRNVHLLNFLNTLYPEMLQNKE